MSFHISGIDSSKENLDFTADSFENLTLSHKHPLSPHKTSQESTKRIRSSAFRFMDQPFLHKRSRSFSLEQEEPSSKSHHVASEDEQISMKGSFSMDRWKEKPNLPTPAIFSQLKKRIVRNPVPSNSDRFIPSRRILDNEEIAVFSDSKPPLPSNYSEERYLRGLNDTFFGSQVNPHSLPKLRLAKPSIVDLEPPSLREDEMYPQIPIKRWNMQGWIKDDFYSHPIAYSPTSDLMAVITQNQPYDDFHGNRKFGGQVYLVNMKNYIPRFLFNPQALCDPYESPVSCVFSKRGDLLILGKVDGSLEIWSCKNDIKRINTFTLSPAEINAVAIRDDLIYAGDKLGQFFRINPKTRQVDKWDRHRKYFCSIVISPNGKYLATGAGDKKVKISFVEAPEKLHMHINAHDHVRAIAFDSTSNYVAMGHGDQNPLVTIYDLSNPTKEPIIVTIDDALDITNILWGKNRLITTHADGTYRVIPLSISLNSGKYPIGKIHRVFVFNSQILFASIRNKDKRQLILGGTKSIKLYNLPESKRRQRPSILSPLNNVR